MLDRILTREFLDGDYRALADYQAEEVQLGFTKGDEGITLTMEELGAFARFVLAVGRKVNQDAE